MRLTILLVMALGGPQNPPGLPQWLKSELPVIRAAAERNGLRNEDWPLLLAIRRAERGADGKQFGIMDSRAYNLDKQAAWASCTIIKHHVRHDAHSCGLDFVGCLARRYAPIGAENDPDGLNANWERNIRGFLKR